MSEHVEPAGPDAALEAPGQAGATTPAIAAPGHVRPAGSPCANCGTALLGPWCHRCGQFGDDFHRSAWHLVAEVFEGILHLDGRVWRTLPDLALHPARLTRAYIEGHRAPQIPPLRLFLVVLLVLFLSGSIGEGGGTIRAQMRDAGDRPDEVRVEIAGRRMAAQEAWLRERTARAIAHPEEFKLIVEHWSERFAFLMLPLAAALLSLLFAFDRRFWLFDHLIFAMHSLAFQGLLLVVFFLSSRALPGGIAGWILAAAPIHLFKHMKGVYGTSTAGTLLRMALLFAGSAVGAALLGLGLLWVGLASVESG